MQEIFNPTQHDQETIDANHLATEAMLPLTESNIGYWRLREKLQAISGEFMAILNSEPDYHTPVHLLPMVVNPAQIVEMEVI